MAEETKKDEGSDFLDFYARISDPMLVAKFREWMRLCEMTDPRELLDSMLSMYNQIFEARVCKGNDICFLQHNPLQLITLMFDDLETARRNYTGRAKLS